jgi:hypothetical protein
MSYRILLNSQGELGNGASTPPDPAEGFKRLLAKHENDAIRVAEKLYGENYELRRDNSALKGRVPAEGDVILKGDDLKRWQKYQDLGDPGEIRKSLDSGKDAIAERDRFARGELYRKAAEVAGYKPAVFARLAEQDGLAIEIGEVKKDGKAVPTAFVKGEDDSTTPLNVYVDSKWSEFKPALGGSSLAQGGTPARPSLVQPRLDAEMDPLEAVRRGLANSGRYAS